MAKTKLFWEFIRDRLEVGSPVVLLWVVHSIGSSPGRQGFKMVVAPNHEMQGSIGGGIMEHKLIEMALAIIKNGSRQVVLKKQIHQDGLAKDRSGMICSGEQTVAVCPLWPDSLPIIMQILNALTQNINRAVSLSPQGLAYLAKLEQHRFAYHGEGAHWEYTTPLSYQDTAYVIGAGHVGLATTQVLSQLDFEVTLIDDRQGLNTWEENNYAHHKLIAPYEQIGEHIVEGANSYVVIMTFGYRSDLSVARQLLGRPFKFLGMMGSQAKIKEMRQALSEEGYPKAHIDAMVAPIGLPIASKTPEEIAVSIAAQLIQYKNANL